MCGVLDWRPQLGRFKMPHRLSPHQMVENGESALFGSRNPGHCSDPDIRTLTLGPRHSLAAFPYNHSMGPTPPMVIPLLVMLMAGVAVLASTYWLVTWIRERAAMRRAGIGPKLPGCDRCLYPMRGWNGPKCPECGGGWRSGYAWRSYSQRP
jgi:hypothetical protein